MQASTGQRQLIQFACSSKMKKTKQQILQEMVRQRYTVAILSRELGLHRNTVSGAINHGLNRPTRDRIERILWPPRKAQAA